jgi:hypothetical protein
VDCFKQIVSKDGFSSLFRGLSGPALFATPRFAIIFHANAYSRKMVSGKLGDSLEWKSKLNLYLESFGDHKYPNRIAFFTYQGYPI